jgi:adhesin/invasin
MQMNKIKPVYNLVAMLLMVLITGCGDGGGVTQTGTVTLSADKAHAIANGTDTVTLTATVKDGSGSPVAYQLIEFKGVSQDSSLCLTDADGTAVLHLSNPPVGPSRAALLTVTATCGEITSNKVVVAFSNPPQNAASVTLEAEKTVVVVDGTDKVRLTATVKDENGAPIAGQAVVFNIPPGPYLILLGKPGMPSQPFTNAAGQAETTIQTTTYSQKYGGFVGSQTVTYTVSSGGATSNAITITFIQPPPNAASITLVADKTQAIADSSDAVTITATVRDINGAPSPGQTVVFNVPLGVSPYLKPATTDANGTTVIRLKYPPVGPVNSAVLAVTATSGGVTSNEVVITFSNPPQNAAAVTLEADKTVVLTDGTDQVRLTATVKDGNGAPIAGQAVVFNVPSLPYLVRTILIHNYTNTAGQLVQTLKPLPNVLVGSQSISVSATSGGVTSSATTITFTQPPN